MRNWNRSDDPKYGITPIFLSEVFKKKEIQMPTLAEELPGEIARLEKKFGPDNRFVKMLKEQLNAINTGKSTRQLFLTGGDVMDLQNLPFDPAEAAGEASLRLTEKGEKRASRRAKPK